MFYSSIYFNQKGFKYIYIYIFLLMTYVHLFRRWGHWQHCDYEPEKTALASSTGPQYCSPMGSEQGCDLHVEENNVISPLYSHFIYATKHSPKTRSGFTTWKATVWEKLEKKEKKMREVCETLTNLKNREQIFTKEKMGSKCFHWNAGQRSTLRKLSLI